VSSEQWKGIVMSDVRTFEDLEIWKRSCQLAVDICVALHDSKNYALKDQMTRAAISIPSNIAEGCERDSTADFIRFLRYSKGSCGELRTQTYIHERVQKKLNLSGLPEAKEIIQETKEISAMLQGLINALDRKQKNSNT
jgi:four helix bundle protein